MIDREIKKNIIWIITTLFAIGAFAASVKYQGITIDGIKVLAGSNEMRLYQLEKEAVRIGRIEKDISEIKEDCKEIKKIILKPAFEK